MSHHHYPSSRSRRQSGRTDADVTRQERPDGCWMCPDEVGPVSAWPGRTRSAAAASDWFDGWDPPPRMTNEKYNPTLRLDASKIWNIWDKQSCGSVRVWGSDLGLNLWDYATKIRWNDSNRTRFLSEKLNWRVVWGHRQQSCTLLDIDLFPLICSFKLNYCFWTDFTKWQQW